MRTRMANLGLDVFLNGRACGLQLRGTALDRIGGAALGGEVLARATISAPAASAAAATACAFALARGIGDRTRLEARCLFLLLVLTQQLRAHHLATLRLLLVRLLLRTRFPRLARFTRFALLTRLALFTRLALLARLTRRTRLLRASFALRVAIIATRLLLLFAARLALLARLLISTLARAISPLAVAPLLFTAASVAALPISLALSVAGASVLERGLCLCRLRRGLGSRHGLGGLLEPTEEPVHETHGARLGRGGGRACCGGARGRTLRGDRR